MAVNPITLLQGTTANATDVETKVNPLYSSIDNSNISAAAGIVFSKLDSSTVASIATVQTLSNKTFSTNTVFTAGLSVSAAQRLYLDGGTNTYFQESSDGVLDLYIDATRIMRAQSTLINFTSVDLYIAVTKKLYLDGGTDSYIFEATDGVIQTVTNGTTRLQVGTSGVSVLSANFSIPAAQALYLDGGTDTYLIEQSADTVRLYTGGGQRLEIGSTGAYFTNGVSTAATTKLWMDGGGDTYWIESSANTVQIFTGGSSRATIDSSGFSFVNDLKMTATTKLYLDGGSNTYISEASGDEMAFFAGGTNCLSIAYNAGSPYFGSGNSDVIIGATKKVRLDGATSGNTHISETSADTVTHTCGGTSAMIVTSSGIQLVAQDPPAANVATSASFAKVFAEFQVTGGGASISAFGNDYNVDYGASSAASGVATITFDRDFSTSDFTAVCTGYSTSGASPALVIRVVSTSATGVTMTPWDVSTGALYTGNWIGQFVAFGTQ